MIIDRIFERGKIVFQPLIRLLGQHILPHLGQILFIIGIIVFTNANINLIGKPIFETTALLGEDDSYTYITKGMQTKTPRVLKPGSVI